MLFLMYNMGNSGGSWMGDVISSHPKCLALEEPRRKLGLPEIGANYPMEQLQARLLLELRRRDVRGQVFGFIKGFRGEIVRYVLERGGSVTQQLRDPMRVVHGTRKRHAKAIAYWGRPPASAIEDFQGRVRHMATRYAKYIERSDRFQIIRLEDLMESLQSGDLTYFHTTLETITQIPWTTADVERAAQIRPRYRENAPIDALWDPDWEENPKASWEKRKDPPAAAIWDRWDDWQRAEFETQFKDVCRTLGYTIGGTAWQPQTQS